LKLGKPNKLTSYQPIKLLPIISIVFEKLLLKRLFPMVEMSRLIPKHQFDFRQRHYTIEKTHQITQRKNGALEKMQYSFEEFLDISQAFDKVWNTGLLCKLRQSLLLNYLLILKSYLHSRHFLIKVETEYTELSSVLAGVPQENVLGPLLHLLYTADLPTSQEFTTATFTDNTAEVTMDSDPAIASQKLQIAILQNCNTETNLDLTEYNSGALLQLRT
jgi:hypothetical protein